MRILTLIFAVGSAARNQCSSFHADIAIFIDASETTSEYGFDKQKLFAQKIVRWLPVDGSDCNVKIVPYSWTLDKPLRDFDQNMKFWHHKSLLARANYQTRKGPRRPLSRLAKDLVDNHFQIRKIRPEAKQIAIIITAEKTDKARNDIVKSFFDGVEEDKIPFVVVVGVDQENNIQHLMKIAENPCFVQTVSSFDKLYISLPIVKQRLCEIMVSDHKSPKGYEFYHEQIKFIKNYTVYKTLKAAQQVSRKRRTYSDGDVDYDFSPEIVGLPICSGSFELFVSYDGGSNRNLANQQKLLKTQQEFVKKALAGFANYDVYSHMSQEKQQYNNDGMPFHTTAGFEPAGITLLPKGKRDKYNIEGIG